MPGKNTRKLSPRKFALSLCLLLSACSRVPVPNVRECVVAGVIQAGFDCAESNTGKTSQMDFEQSIEWLEAEMPTNTTPGRAGAVCRSDDDFTKTKIALEQACALLKNRCTPEMKSEIERQTGNVSQLLKNGARKKKVLEMDRAITPEHAPMEPML